MKQSKLKIAILINAQICKEYSVRQWPQIEYVDQLKFENYDEQH
jgi:hypothetical protein